MVLSLLLSTLVIYIPFLADAFDFAHISAAEYAASMALAFQLFLLLKLLKQFKESLKSKYKLFGGVSNDTPLSIFLLPLKKGGKPHTA